MTKRGDIDWHELSDHLDPALSFVERQIFANADERRDLESRVQTLQFEITNLKGKIGRNEKETDALKAAADLLLLQKGRQKRWIPDPVHTGSDCKLHGSCIDCDACKRLCECL